MPFVYPKKNKEIKEDKIRDFSFVDDIVRKALEEVEDWDPMKGMEGLESGKYIYLLNNKVSHPPKDKADPHKFLVLLCLNKGLNMGEIEKWLDYNFLNFTGEFYYDRFIGDGRFRNKSHLIEYSLNKFLRGEKNDI